MVLATRLCMHNLQITQRFQIEDDEMLMGLGQYLHPCVNSRECDVVLCQGNMDIAVPVLLSTKGVELNTFFATC